MATFSPPSGFAQMAPSSEPSPTSPFKITALSFPGGSVVKNPPTNAGDNRFDSWSRKIPHAKEQLSPCPTAIEPVLSLGTTTTAPVHCNYGGPNTLGPMSHSERSHNEKPKHS